jgi:hypothetical protein
MARHVIYIIVACGKTSFVSGNIASAVGFGELRALCGLVDVVADSVELELALRLWGSLVAEF